MTTTITNPDQRIDRLTSEIDRLRDEHAAVDDQSKQMLLRLAEVQLNLARQDQLLARVDSTLHGNGKPGLCTRVDRVEQWVTTLSKAIWLLIAAVSAAWVKVAIDHLK